MDFLEFSHNPGLVAASVIVALLAGFTGLNLTKDLSSKSVRQRKMAVALASVALGGGIWSMHFVAMLGLQLPILFYYDAAITLASALVCILIVGVALILLHFTERTRATIVAAGALVGAGILAMHYIGMAGLELCRAVYTPSGLISAGVLAMGLCVAAFGVAYGQRSDRNILLGTLCFGLAVAAVHFAAVAGTRFVKVPGFTEFGPIMSNEVLALGVILSSFVLFGAFLWVGVTYLMPRPATGPAAGAEAAADPPLAAPATPPMRIPCERDGGKLFIAAADVAFVRADGHYTQVYTDGERLFCVWPITEATKRLLPQGFLKVHRSYLINPAKVAAFERKKDSGRCTFEADDLPHVPVSRSNLKDVQLALGA
ncbi:carbon monoxide dehydrogenase operon C protein [Candidatus Rhodobacter oscarellae]|uniref:Carbon monoxide dehydrogenase operon C protein n=1 Tax=Candidatus Rhodobacter oscarellae TaxID=1675527 RepID=A0A0J9E859_9RHOB|nr:MHYT domain-containing protein [Candidatus Rhodobacter lobularis]KMW57949.1 carbon monoxide dehydrogenase operon C protein [Candidatus Rhodobacter lobularis]